VVYYAGRALPPDRVALSTDNALRLIDLERDLGIFRELGWQRFALERPWLREASEFTYSYLHLPVMLAVGLVVFCTDARKYRVIRNTVLISGLLGMAFYWFVPVTPPRLLEATGQSFGFVDSIGSERLKPGPLANDYAAIPSYHFGWIMLATLGLWWISVNVVVRLASVAFLGFMAWAIVATANHYFLDMAHGGVMVLLALWLAVRLERMFDQRPSLAGRLALRCGPVRFPF